LGSGIDSISDRRYFSFASGSDRPTQSSGQITTEFTHRVKLFPKENEKYFIQQFSGIQEMAAPFAMPCNDKNSDSDLDHH